MFYTTEKKALGAERICTSLQIENYQKTEIQKILVRDRPNYEVVIITYQKIPIISAKFITKMSRHILIYLYGVFNL